jgi:hypothetical protein
VKIKTSYSTSISQDIAISSDAMAPEPRKLRRRERVKKIEIQEQEIHDSIIGISELTQQKQ